MKLSIIIAVACLALTQAYPTDLSDDSGKIKIPEKCSDVFAVKQCERLNRMATQLKLKSEEVKKAAIEAFKQGKATSVEMFKKAKEFLQQQVLSKKCEDLTTVENCQKLRKMAADLKVQANKVAEFVLNQVAILKTKECEDFLDAKQCTQLKDVAEKLKIKYEKLQDMMVDAYLEAKENGKDMLIETYNKIKNYVKATKCEDIFNPGLCTSFRKYAEKTKVALPRIMETAVDLIKKGVVVGKELVKKVYDIVDYFYNCTDVFDKSSCERMGKWAAKMKVTAQEFEIAVKKYVRIAIEKGTSIYKTIKDFVKNKIYCKFTRNCINAEDVEEVEDESDVAFGLFEDYKEKLRNILNNNPILMKANASMKEYAEKMIEKSKSMWDFMKKVANEVKTGASENAQKMRAFWKEFLVLIVTQ